MRNRDESERERGIRVARPRGRASLLFALAATLAAPAVADAARLTDVRVGRHPGFTRVVLELDAPAPYRLEEPVAGRMPELRVLVAAEGAARALASGAPLVRSVRVEPGEPGAAVRIELTTAAVRVEELLLSGPPRIVLDLRRTPERAVPEVGIEPAEPGPPEAAEGRDPDEPRLAARAPSPPEAPASPPEQEPSPPTTVPGVEATLPATAAPTAGVPEPPSASEAPPPTVEPPGAALPSEIAAASPEETRELPAAATPAEVAVAPPEETQEPPAATPLEARAATPPEAPVEVVPRVPPAARAAWLTDRAWGVGRIGGLVVLAAAILLLAFATWWRLRRRPAARERIVPEAEEARPAAAPPPLERAPEPSSAEHGLPAEEVRRRFEEVTQRLARLDARLDELLDARESLGRTLEAQGEELRVQRAAIARLQRLARFLARREDPAAEGLRRSPWS